MPASTPASGPSRLPSRLAARWMSGGSGITGTLSARKAGQRIIGHHHEVHDLRPQPLDDMRHHRPAAQRPQRLQRARPHAPALAARQHDADQCAGPHRPEMFRTAFPAMMALCGPHDDKQGEERMAFSIAKAANWLHQVHRARAVVGWWPEQFAIEDERTAYKVQDALAEEAGRRSRARWSATRSR